MLEILRPDWPAPPQLAAAFVLRSGGVSEPPYASANLALHVGDDPRRVAANRAALGAQLALPSPPCWLEQVHGTVVLPAAQWESPPRADGAWTAQAGRVCAVLVADCLPVLLCSTDGAVVAAVHAGWRGLAAGIVDKAAACLRAASQAPLMAWLGPAICPRHFQVGDEVRDRFLAMRAGDAGHFVRDGDRWRADLGALARDRLREAGVSRIDDCGICSFGEPARCFSHRRDGACGRMAALIWRR